MNKQSYVLGFFILLLFSDIHGNLIRSKYFIAVQSREDFDVTKLSFFTSLLPPKQKMYADPMLFYQNGINYIFFEDYDYKKGVISYVTVDKTLQFSEPRLALELPCHLSFPYLFQDGDHIYMTPETYLLQEVGLYRAVEFPNCWEKVRALVKGESFADPILFKHNGYFWLFTSTNDYSLRIYFSKDLAGEFLPHPINKEKILGRNAGGIYVLDNELFRPVMDCSQGYGWAISLRQIDRLTPFEFVEKEIYHIKPNWAPGLDGTHTFNINEDLVVYDGRRIIKSTEDDKYSQKKVAISRDFEYEKIHQNELRKIFPGL